MRRYNTLDLIFLVWVDQVYCEEEKWLRNLFIWIFRLEFFDSLSFSENWILNMKEMKIE